MTDPNIGIGTPAQPAAPQPAAPPPPVAPPVAPLAPTAPVTQAAPPAMPPAMPLPAAAPAAPGVPGAPPAPGNPLPAPTAGALSLADIAGLDFDGVKEERFQLYPVLTGAFECAKCLIEPMDHDLYKYKVIFTAHIKHIAALTPQPGEDASIVAQELIADEGGKGALVEQTFLIASDTPMKGVGRAKAFIADTGFQVPPGMDFDSVLKAMEGHVFSGKITHRADKKDKEKIYMSLTPVPAS